MKFMSLIYNRLNNFAYFINSRHNFLNKLKIFLTWLKISFKFFLLSKPFNLKTEKIFGYQIDAFDYGTICFLYEEIFYKNEYFFVSKNKAPVIFDCGANIGFATLFFKWLYPESEIYAFEPDKRTFEILAKNVEQNKLTNVHLFNAAISDKDGKISFFVDPKNPGALTMSTKKERISGNEISVSCLSLSSLIKHRHIQYIDYIKMDIEGSEQQAVEDLSANDHLKNIDKFCIEYHHRICGHKSCLSKFLEIFEKNGFEYQIDTHCIPTNAEHKFQDVLLYLYRS